MIATLDRTAARDEDSRVLEGDWRRPATVRRDHEVVLEHTVKPGARATFRLINRAFGAQAILSWRGLDRVHQWIYLTGDRWVTAIEPVNCSVLGRTGDRATGASYLDPGARRTTGVVVEVSAA